MIDITQTLRWRKDVAWKTEGDWWRLLDGNWKHSGFIRVHIHIIVWYEVNEHNFPDLLEFLKLVVQGKLIWDYTCSRVWSSVAILSYCQYMLIFSLISNLIFPLSSLCWEYLDIREIYHLERIQPSFTHKTRSQNYF